MPSMKNFGTYLNVAADAAAAPAERDKALQMIRKISAEHNRLPGDFISLVGNGKDDDVFMYIFDPSSDCDALSRRIGRLEEEVEEEKKTIVYLRHVLDNEQEAAQQKEARLLIKLEALQRTKDIEVAERDLLIAERDARIAALEAQLGAKAADDSSLVEETVVGSATSPEGQGQAEIKGTIVDQPEPSPIDAKALKQCEWKVFERLAAAGMSRAKIARELTRALGRAVTAMCVGELMRLRWLPSSGRRFALSASG